MNRCHHFQAQLLEHVYGLVEGEDRQELLQHLADCGTCQSALEKSQQAQQQLARAAKQEFPGVRFATPRAPQIVAAGPAPGAGSPGWFRWAVAAGILLAIGGVGIPSGLYSQQRDRVEQTQAHLLKIKEDARQVDDQYRTRLSQVDNELLSIQQQIEDLEREQQQQVAKVWTEVSNKRLRMTISGPKAPEPGAPNNYKIETRTLNQQPAPAKVSVRVLDEKQQVVYEKDIASKGSLQFALPPSLPLKPSTELTLEVSARNATGAEEKLTEKLTLVAPLYLTHLTTDKPMYQPGEVVHFRSLTLERFGLRPVSEALQLIYTITRPNGQEAGRLAGSARVADAEGKALLLGPDKKPIQGVGAGDYALEPTTEGGEYTLTVSEAQNRFPPQQRKFLVNKYEKPRLNKELEFARSSYGPGETVVATCKAARVEGGGALAGQPVSASIQVDGRAIAPESKDLRTDALGAVDVRCKLPAQIDRGVASLTVTFTDGGSVESIVRPIPIVLGKLQVEFFPEGGDLVAGIPNRVYFQARTMLGKPAELKGRIVDDQDAVVADAQTFNVPALQGANQGMGRFEFTPLAGKKYQLKIDEPVGIQEIVGPGVKAGQFLPAAKADGVVLSVPGGVTTDKDPIHVVVRSGQKDRMLLVGAYCRGRLMSHQRLEAKAGQAAELDLKPEAGAGGVYRVTVFEEHAAPGNTPALVPVAERLIYRVPAERLQLAIQADRQHYVPGDRVKLQCLAVDEQNKPVPAILMVAVADKSVLTMADEKTFRSLPTHFLLTTEVRKPEDLEHADFLLTPPTFPPSKGGVVAPLALDLLLGTQGWRRFAEQNLEQFRNKYKQDAEKLLVLSNNQFIVRDSDLAQQKVRKVQEQYTARFVPLQQQQAQASDQRLLVRNDPKLQEQRQRLEEEARRTQAQYHAALGALQRYEQYGQKVRGLVLPGLALILLLASIAGLASAIARASMPHALPYLVTAGCSLALLGFVTVMRFDAAAPGGVAFSLGEPGWAAPEREARMARADDQPEAEHLKKAEMKPGEAKGKGADAAAPGLPPRAPAPVTAKPADAKFMAPQRGAPVPEGRLGAPAMKMPLNQPMAREKAKEQGLLQADKARKELEQAQLGGFGQRDGRALLNGVAPGKDAQFDEFRRRQNRALEGQDRAAALAGAAPPPPPFVVREYAHQHSTTGGQVRSDFTETLYWHPVLVLPQGKAEVAFDLCDSVTTFQVLAAGHTLDGRLGAVTTAIESRLPLTLEPKLPLEVTRSDTIIVPLTIANNTDAARAVNVKVQPTDLKLIDGKDNDSVSVPADTRTRRLYRFQPTLVSGEARLQFDGSSAALHADSIRKSFTVVPDGFPIVGAHSDLLEKVAQTQVVLPKDMLKGTLQCQVIVYPSTLADLQKGLEALLREPRGCFEQTSTSNYPNLLVLDYLKESDQLKDRPEVARRAQDLLNRGYQKLTSFECTNTAKKQREGYEWFGGTAPAHEALTAYGLMQFRDMARVHDVDKNMVERTRQYLLSRKDGKGGFQRNPRALDTFGRAPEDTTNAYIVWALTESGKEDDLTKELEVLGKKAQDSKDPYFLALVANAQLNRDQSEAGVAILKRLAEAQKKEGYLEATQTSITGSRGRDLQIETTALTLFGWLKAQRPELFNAHVQNAVKWIGQQRGGRGGFGSTQSTILALKALIAYAKANKQTAEAGELSLFVGDKLVNRLTFLAGTTEALVLNVPTGQPHKGGNTEEVLHEGKNDIRVEVTGKNVFPYTLTWSYQTLTPVSVDQCALRLKTRLDRPEAKEGESVRLTATVENVSGKGQGMALAILGLPAGLTLPEDMKQLKDLMKLRNNDTEPGPISFFEVRGRELVLYWRDMAPDKKVEVSLDLICRVPGTYHGPASRAYLYYNADHKCWIEPLAINITPMK